jgi:hypothetical protein
MTNNNERRAPSDRRDDDNGPPHGWKDRRRRAERRIPEIGEQTISESDWEHYFGNRPPAAPEAAVENEVAASILDKARD